MKEKLKHVTWLRVLVYVLGLIVLACGITLNAKTNLGMSPVVSVPFAVSQLVHVQFSVMTFAYYLLLIALQWLMLRKDFKHVQWLQIVSSLITSGFIQVFEDILPTFHNTALRWVFLIVAIALTGIGASIVVGMHYVPNPADGFAAVLGLKLKKSFGFGKNVLDFTSIAISAVLGLALTHHLLGIGWGTIVAMILTGRVVAWFQPVSNRIFEKVSKPKVEGV